MESGWTNDAPVMPTCTITSFLGKVRLVYSYSVFLALTRNLSAFTLATMQSAYQHETFNEQTGIGETKHGLPLGCLNIKLIRLDGMTGDPQVGRRAACTVRTNMRTAKLHPQLDREEHVKPHFPYHVSLMELDS